MQKSGPELKDVCKVLWKDEHPPLVLNWEWRLLSKSNILTSVLKLRNELSHHLKTGEVLHIKCNFNTQLAYLGNVFDKVNIHTTSLKGDENNIFFKFSDKLK